MNLQAAVAKCNLRGFQSYDNAWLAAHEVGLKTLHIFIKKRPPYVFSSSSHQHSAILGV
jgi:uncharacterized cupin superfamily protein